MGSHSLPLTTTMMIILTTVQVTGREGGGSTQDAITVFLLARILLQIHMTRSSGGKED